MKSLLILKTYAWLVNTIRNPMRDLRFVDSET